MLADDEGIFMGTVKILAFIVRTYLVLNILRFHARVRPTDNFLEDGDRCLLGFFWYSDTHYWIIFTILVYASYKFACTYIQQLTWAIFRRNPSNRTVVFRRYRRLRIRDWRFQNSYKFTNFTFF